MKKIVLAAVAALTLVVGAAPSFAGSNEGVASQSANIQAGGGAYPPGIVAHYNGR